MNRSTFWMIKYMNGSIFSNARYMNGVGFEILACTPVPKLLLSYRPPPPTPPLKSRHSERCEAVFFKNFSVTIYQPFFFSFSFFFFLFFFFFLNLIYEFFYVFYCFIIFYYFITFNHLFCILFFSFFHFFFFCHISFLFISFIFVTYFNNSKWQFTICSKVNHDCSHEHLWCRQSI